MLALAAPAQRPQQITISAYDTGKQFDGIGAVNGGGATSVLLKDYPEPQRSQIMDMVYKPMFGASVSTILVEVPGDGNSTQGSMPSHAHERNDANFMRGYMWWVMQEAKCRNAGLSLEDFKEQLTGVQAPQAAPRAVPSGTFDLMGRPWTENRRGLSISNGKKYIRR